MNIFVVGRTPIFRQFVASKSPTLQQFVAGKSSTLRQFFDSRTPTLQQFVANKSPTLRQFFAGKDAPFNKSEQQTQVSTFAHPPQSESPQDEPPQDEPPQDERNLMHHEKQHKLMHPLSPTLTQNVSRETFRLRQRVSRATKLDASRKTHLSRSNET